MLHKELSYSIDLTTTTNYNCSGGGYMNTIEFESLDINAKIKYLNAKLKEGKTVIRIREEIGISEKYLQKEIKKGGFKYNQKLRQYLPTTGTTTTSTTNNNLYVVPNNTLVVDENKMGVLNYLEDNFNILTEFLEKYKSTTISTTETTTQDIVINLVDDKHLKPKPKSIRINEFVYRDWQKFCENNKYYPKQELTSMALKEYMKNHSK